MKKSFKDTKAFKCACEMPVGLRHQLSGEFDWKKSEVMEWLLDQPEILSYLFSKFNSSGAILYDPEKWTWRGRDSE